jgi:hypothetical protein
MHMRAEWGAVTWEETIVRTQAFAEIVIAEARRELPAVIGEGETSQWTARVQNNIHQLAQAVMPEDKSMA